MGWVAMLLLALAVAAGLYPFVRKDRGALQFLLAALLLALAGYSWQGRPDQPGSPKAAQPPRAVPDDDFATLHPDLLGRFDRAYTWMQLADGDRRRGNPQGAAEVLQSAVRANPRSYSLWIAYGYGLVAASDGAMSPAAQLAFDRASRLAPNHPGPLFFYGLALARGGNWDQAEQVWRGQLTELGTSHPVYRAALEERLAAVRDARTNGTAVRPATAPPQQNGPAPGAPAAPAAPTDGNAAAPAPPGNSAN
ncbi:MAG TPA: tetratricopeptide repeat protein [Allosphingosinicella sp.]|nr:tetratricopeptide repeat protein [Allosphingosinicella sp.]